MYVFKDTGYMSHSHMVDFDSSTMLKDHQDKPFTITIKIDASLK